MHSRSYAPASLAGELPDYQDLGDSYSATYPVSYCYCFGVINPFRSG